MKKSNETIKLFYIKPKNISDFLLHSEKQTQKPYKIFEHNENTEQWS